MQTKTICKRLLALVLAAVLMFNNIPLQAIAMENSDTDAGVEEYQSENPGDGEIPGEEEEPGEGEVPGEGEEPEEGETPGEEEPVVPPSNKVRATKVPVNGDWTIAELKAHKNYNALYTYASWSFSGNKISDDSALVKNVLSEGTDYYTQNTVPLGAVNFVFSIHDITISYSPGFESIGTVVIDGTAKDKGITQVELDEGKHSIGAENVEVKGITYVGTPNKTSIDPANAEDRAITITYEAQLPTQKVTFSADGGSLAIAGLSANADGSFTVEQTKTYKVTVTPPTDKVVSKVTAAGQEYGAQFELTIGDADVVITAEYEDIYFRAVADDGIINWTDKGNIDSLAKPELKLETNMPDVDIKNCKLEYCVGNLGDEDRWYEVGTSLDSIINALKAIGAIFGWDVEKAVHAFGTQETERVRLVYGDWTSNEVTLTLVDSRPTPTIPAKVEIAYAESMYDALVTAIGIDNAVVTIGEAEDANAALLDAAQKGEEVAASVSVAETNTNKAASGTSNVTINFTVPVSYTEGGVKVNGNAPVEGNFILGHRGTYTVAADAVTGKEAVITPGVKADMTAFYLYNNGAGITVSYTATPRKVTITNDSAQGEITYTGLSPKEDGTYTGDQLTSITITATPKVADGYAVARVTGFKVNNVQATENVSIENGIGILTIPAGADDVTVDVVYETIVYVTISAAAGEHGSLTIDGAASIKVEKGAENATKQVTLVAKPDSGYAVGKLNGDATLTAGTFSGYTYTVQADIKIDGSVTEIAAEYIQPTLSISAKGNGILNWNDAMDKSDIVSLVAPAITMTDNMEDVALANCEIQYLAGTALGQEIWFTVGSTLDQIVEKLGNWVEQYIHAFGTQETESVRVKYAGNNRYPETTSNSVTLKLQDTREAAPLNEIVAVEVSYSEGENAMYNAMVTAIGETLTGLQYGYDEDGLLTDSFVTDAADVNAMLKAAAENDPTASVTIKVKHPSTLAYKATEKEVTVTFKDVYYSLSVTVAPEDAQDDGGVKIGDTQYKHGNSVKVYYGQEYTMEVLSAEGYGVSVTNYDGNKIPAVTKDTAGITVTYSNSSIVQAGSAVGGTVQVKTTGDFASTLTGVSGADVTIQITPEGQYYVTGVKVTDGNGNEVATSTLTFSGDVATATFTVDDATTTTYTVTPEFALAALVAKENPTLNYYEGITAEKFSNEAIFNAVVDAANSSPKDVLVFGENVSVKYLASSAVTDVWVDINGTATVALDDVYHAFGKSSTGVERIKITWDGSNVDVYPTVELIADLTLVDGRIETKIVVPENLSIVYGSYADYDALVAKLAAAGVKVTDAEGNPIEGASFDVALKSALEDNDTLGDLGDFLGGIIGQDKLDELLGSLEGILGIGLDKLSVGEHDLIFTYDSGSEENGKNDTHKDAVAEGKLTVTKADAVVTVTEDNVVKYENISKVTRDFLFTVKPGANVVIEDEVDHIAFLMGLDLIEGKLVATVDISKLVSADSDIAQSAIDAILNGLVGEYDLSNFMDIVAKLAELLGDNGVADDVINSDAFKQIADMIAEAADGIEVTIKVTNGDFAPKNHGAYAFGVVTTDRNYNTAFGASYLVIAADFVTIDFIDATGEVNNEQMVMYDGQPKSMTAVALDENGTDITSTGTMKYYYLGVQNDATAYASEEPPVHAGTYAVTATFVDEALENVGIGEGILVITPSDKAVVAVDDLKTVTYDENNEVPVSIADMISVTPAEAKVAVITAGINVGTDFSEEGWDALEGNVNIDFPEKADAILKELLPEAYGEGITASDVTAKLAEIKTKLAEIGIDGAAMDQILSVLNQVPNAGKLTFHNTYNGSVNSAALPRKIGGYLVTAVAFDPDYLPEAGAGVLLITPKLTEEVLAWNYSDSNNVITRPVLNNRDMGAKATVDSNNTAKIQYIFIGLNKDGELTLDKATAETVQTVAKGLRNGAYAQIAYIWEGLDASMIVAEPISREFLLTPQPVTITFNADGMDADPENVRKFTYTGSPIEMPVAVAKLDGTALTGTTTVTYMGVDSQGNQYSTATAPTNVGVYAVTVEYQEKDTNGSIAYAGVNTGVLVIDFAQAAVSVDIADRKCDCTDTREPCECQIPVDVLGAIEKTNGTEAIAVITDEQGNVNILVPASWGLDAANVEVAATADAIAAQIRQWNDTYGVKKLSNVIGSVVDQLNALEDASVIAPAKDAVEKLLAELGDMTPASVKAKVEEVIAKLEALEAEADTGITEAIQELNALKAELDNIDAEIAKVENALKNVPIKSVSVNGETKYSCGTYQVVAVAFGPNHKLAVAKDTFVIYRQAAYVTFQAEKILTGRDLADQEFTFTLMDEGKNLVETVKNAADGSVSFSELTFSEAGTYTYTIQETAGEAVGVTYDDAVYTVIVTVTEGENYELTAEVVYQDAEQKTVESPVFTNVYKPAPAKATISGEKLLIGREMKAEEFQFALMEGKSVVSVASNNAKGEFHFDLTFAEPGVHVYTVKELVPEDADPRMEYSDKTYTVKVRVTEKNGILEARVFQNRILFKNVYRPGVAEVEITAEKKLEGRKLHESEFQFEIRDQKGHLLSEGRNSRKGKIFFQPIEFERAGKYVLNVTERKGDQRGITYDDAVYTVVVNVTMGEDGDLEADVKYVNGKIVFHNTYKHVSSGTPDDSNPKTGDTIGMFLMTGFLSGAALVALLDSRKRKFYL